MKSTLLVVGAVFELDGIVAIGSPALVPGLLRFAAWIRAHWRRAADRCRRLAGRPRSHVVPIGTVVVQATAGRVSPSRSVGAVASLEEEVAYLLRRDQEAQRRMNRLEERLCELEGGVKIA